MSLSGNFGELRQDHFHTGLDFRTERKAGLPVFSSAEGYVSRVAVSPYGYGRALYIDHPNNTTTVYGHLEKFRKDIEEYVKAEQYRLQSYAVDLKVSPGRIRVERQQQIAWSGNSGNSGGPHLHYEIRDTPTQDALNPLRTAEFNVKDKTPPKIKKVQFYPLNSTSHVEFMNRKKSYVPVAAGDTYRLNPGNAVLAWGEIGVAVLADDYFDENTSPNGIYRARLFLDGKEVFGYSLDRISFSRNRYLNSHLDYEEYANNRTRMVKMWRDRGNRLNIYRPDSLRGILHVDSGKVYSGELVLSDVAGNSSRFRFRIRGVYQQIPEAVHDSSLLFRYDRENHREAPGFEIDTPEGAFYEDFLFYYHTSEREPENFSASHQVHVPSTPIHKSLRIRIKAENLPDSLAPKAFIAAVDLMGVPGYAGGSLRDGWFETSISQFGKYIITCDTISPVIVPLSIKDNALTEPWQIRFNIKDDFSGIKSYTGRVDGQWALFEYDPKTSRLVYRIDPDRLVLGERHTLELTVADMVDNATRYTATFWK